MPVQTQHAHSATGNGDLTLPSPWRMPARDAEPGEAARPFPAPAASPLRRLVAWWWRGWVAHCRGLPR